jgi:hypothetical protein
VKYYNALGNDSFVHQLTYVFASGDVRKDDWSALYPFQIAYIYCLDYGIIFIEQSQFGLGVRIWQVHPDQAVVICRIGCGWKKYSILIILAITNYTKTQYQYKNTSPAFHFIVINTDPV